MLFAYCYQSWSGPKLSYEMGPTVNLNCLYCPKILSKEVIKTFVFTEEPV